MTQLPIPAIEADAIVFAREMIHRFRGGTTPWSADSPMTDAAGRALARHMMRQGALLHPINRLQVIAMARAGDIDAAEVLRTLIIEMLSRGESLPAELAAFNMEVLHGGLHQPPGPKRKDKLLRDLCIAMTVAALVDRFGLSPTRNTASRGRPSARRSACSIVADTNIMGEKAVEVIWNRLGCAMPTVPGWASL